MDLGLFEDGPNVTANHGAIGSTYSFEGLSTIASDES